MNSRYQIQAINKLPCSAGEVVYQSNKDHGILLKQPQEHQETESLIYQDSGSLGENHDPIDYSNVPPEKQRGKYAHHNQQVINCTVDLPNKYYN